MANPTTPVRVRATSLTVMKRVRKAVWKEKDIDQEFARDEAGNLILGNDDLPIRRKLRWRLHCEMLPKEGMMIFSVSPKLTEDDI